VTTPDFSELYNPEVARLLRESTRSAGFSALLGLEIEDCGPGFIVCSLPVTDQLQSGVGAVHGGAIASVIDHALSLAVYPLVEPGLWAATMELKINYVSAVSKGTIRATGKVLSLRRRIGVVRVEVENEGRLVAAAQGTVYVRERAGG